MAAVEHEIAAEKSFNLGRVGDMLEAALAELPSLAAAAATAPPGERAAYVAAYNRRRQRALELYGSLCIQREAMGVRNHDMLAAAYPIPPKLV